MPIGSRRHRPGDGNHQALGAVQALRAFFFAETVMTEKKKEASFDLLVALGDSTLNALHEIAEKEYGSRDEIEAVAIVILDHFATGVRDADSEDRELLRTIFGKTNW